MQIPDNAAGLIMAKLATAPELYRVWDDAEWAYLWNLLEEMYRQSQSALRVAA